MYADEDRVAQSQIDCMRQAPNRPDLWSLADAITQLLEYQFNTFIETDFVI